MKIGWIIPTLLCPVLACVSTHAKAESVLATYGFTIFENAGGVNVSVLDLTVSLVEKDAGGFLFRFANNSPILPASDVDSASIKRIFFEDGLEAFIDADSYVLPAGTDTVKFVEFKKLLDPPGGDNLDPEWKHGTYFGAKENGGAIKGIGPGEVLDISFDLTDGAGIDNLKNTLNVGISHARIAVHVGSLGDNDDYSVTGIGLPYTELAPVPSPTAVFAGMLGIVALTCRRRPKATPIGLAG